MFAPLHPYLDCRLISEEMEYRKKAHTFIFDCCQLLRAKALVIAAAMTICQRYFSQVSFRKIDRNVRRFFSWPFPSSLVVFDHSMGR